MTFKFGDVDTRDLAGVKVTPVDWPSLGGLSLELLEQPGQDGVHYAGQSRGQTEISFEVLVSGSSVPVAYERRDAFAGILDPAQGPLPLQVELEQEWVYPSAMVAEEIQWERVIWRAGSPLSFRGIVTFTTVADPSAHEADPQSVAIGAEDTFTLDRGNTSARPRVTIDVGADAEGADVTVTIGDFAVTIDGGGAAGDVLDLDWSRMEFYRLNGSGRRTGSLVPYMSNYGRPVLRPGRAVTVGCSPAEVTARLWPNARRI